MTHKRVKRKINVAQIRSGGRRVMPYACDLLTYNATLLVAHLYLGLLPRSLFSGEGGDGLAPQTRHLHQSCTRNAHTHHLLVSGGARGATGSRRHGVLHYTRGATALRGTSGRRHLHRYRRAQAWLPWRRLPLHRSAARRGITLLMRIGGDAHTRHALSRYNKGTHHLKAHAARMFGNEGVRARLTPRAVRRGTHINARSKRHLRNK